MVAHKRCMQPEASCDSYESHGKRMYAQIQLDIVISQQISAASVWTMTARSIQPHLTMKFCLSASDESAEQERQHTGSCACGRLTSLHAEAHLSAMSWRPSSGSPVKGPRCLPCRHSGCPPDAAGRQAPGDSVVMANDIIELWFELDVNQQTISTILHTIQKLHLHWSRG